MGQSPDEIRMQIEETRSHLSGTAEAIQDRVQPRRIAQRRLSQVRTRATRVKESVMGSPGFGHKSSGGGIGGVGSGLQDGAGAAMSTVGGTIGQVKSTAASGLESAQHAPDALKQAAAGSPLAAGLVALGAGMVIASLIPPSSQEQTAALAITDGIGLKDGVAEAAQNLRSAVQESAHEAAAQIGSRASEAASHVAEAGQAAGSDLKDQASESAHRVAGAAKS
ncbi:MAG: DUF3618 domain-containing protein [Actinomycetota bacterium]|nr:DUF3618 domain-containing protein [Actinomycetota bacterium]